jgi:predicted PurR-regulated permease PerM
VALVLVALLVAILAPAAGIAYAVSRGVQLFRDIRGFFRAQGEALEALSRSLERLSSFEPPEVERLSVSMERVEASRARLSVELGALGRVREQWAGLLAIYPRK